MDADELIALICIFVVIFTSCSLAALAANLVGLAVGFLIGAILINRTGL